MRFAAASMVTMVFHVQEVLSNKLGMSTEQQILVCSKPEVKKSIELFLRGLVADQFYKQQKTLLPLLTAELPHASKSVPRLSHLNCLLSKLATTADVISVDVSAQSHLFALRLPQVAALDCAWLQQNVVRTA